MRIRSIFSKSPSDGQQEQLPLKTRSLCPECLKVIDAELVERDGKVWMVKSCPEHGPVEDIISTDVEFFLKMRKRADFISPGVRTESMKPSHGNCPDDCGLCTAHRSPAAFLNIDLTNRCNLNCPVCFANANATGYLYEVSFEQVKQMLRSAAAQQPSPPMCVQFAGGEPTLHPQFVECCREAARLGYMQIQVASNGLRFAKSFEFCQQAAEAGLNIVYLQFDGIDDEIYVKTRGRPLVEIKQQAIDNIYRAGMRVCLVPTLVKGVNDHQIGAMIKYAIDNIDAVTAISFQPVAFTGRIDPKQRLAQRFTVSDLARCIQEQGGYADMYRDWYPFSFTAPMFTLYQRMADSHQAPISCHPHCGAATYLIVDSVTKESVPLPRFIDVDRLMLQVKQMAESLSPNSSGWQKKWTWIKLLWHLRTNFRLSQAPTDWKFQTVLEFLRGFSDFRELNVDNTARRADLQRFRWRQLMLASMHFQDVYNYEIDRVQRCVVHYMAPDGGQYPFCTYNSGPCYREKIEKAFARPLTRKALQQIHQQSPTGRAAKPLTPSGLQTPLEHNA